VTPSPPPVQWYICCGGGTPTISNDSMSPGTDPCLGLWGGGAQWTHGGPYASSDLALAALDEWEAANPGADPCA